MANLTSRIFISGITVFSFIESSTFAASINCQQAGTLIKERYIKNGTQQPDGKALQSITDHLSAIYDLEAKGAQVSIQAALLGGSTGGQSGYALQAQKEFQIGQQTLTQNFCSTLKKMRTHANNDLKKMRKNGCKIESLTKPVVEKFNRYNCDQNLRCGMDGGPAGGQSDPVDEIIYPTASVGKKSCGWGVANPIVYPKSR